MAVFSRNLIIRCGLSSSFSAVNHGTTTTCMAFPRSAIEVSVPWVALVGLLFSADGPEVTLSPCPAFEFACSLCCRLKTGLAVVFFSVDFPRAGASSGSSWDYILTYSSVVQGQRATGKEEEHAVIGLEQGLPRPRIFKVFSRSSSSCEVIKKGPFGGVCNRWCAVDDRDPSAPIALGGWSVNDRDWRIIAVSNYCLDTLSERESARWKSLFWSTLEWPLSVECSQSEESLSLSIKLSGTSSSSGSTASLLLQMRSLLDLVIFDSILTSKDRSTRRTWQNQAFG